MAEPARVRSRIDITAGPRRRSWALAIVLACVATLVATGTGLAAGKPGYPDRVTWGGLSWQVKTSTAPVGPGPNVFSKANVAVDPSDHLHLRIARDASARWTCAEVIGPMSYGYGSYSFVVGSDVSALDPNVVLGLFTWSDRAQYAHREIDVEVARWGNATDQTNAQFVVQPADRAGHLSRFIEPAASRTLLRFTWRAGEVSFEARRLDTDTLVAAYAYLGSDVPKPGDERVRLNLWLFGGAPPANGQPVEVVVESFAFAP